MNNTSFLNFVFLLFLQGAILSSSVYDGRRNCGKLPSPTKSNKLTGKIVGGYQVGYMKYPWFAALQIDDDTICGGVLIGPNYVLTAAHCYDEFKNEKLEKVFKIKMGVNNQCKKESKQKVYKTTKVYIHEKYNNNKPYYDIALLKLSGDTSLFMPICLPPKILSDNDQEAEGWIAGFGSMVENGGANSYPCEMREGRILIQNNQTCRAMVKQLSKDPKFLLYTNSICAGYKSGGVDTCQGDSGGPLMTINSGTNTWQTVGVTSFGWGCGEKNQMGVYTDVSRYLDWIQKLSGIKASEEYKDNSNEDSNTSQLDVTSNYIVETFNSIYDHIMNSPHRPTEITITFKNRHHGKTRLVQNRKQAMHINKNGRRRHKV